MFRFPTRRTFLRAAAVGGTLLPAGVLAQRAFVGGLPPELIHPAICRASFGTPVVLPEKRALKLTWNATAICTVGVAVAQEKGYFARHNLDVELVNFGGSTDQLLEAIATAKADAGVGMALRWLKPLEGGFDVKITAGIAWRLHAPVLGAEAAASTSSPTSRARRSASPISPRPTSNFFSIMLHQAGVDPDKEVEWRVFPGDVLPVALKKGEVQAFCQGDPLGWMARERDGLTEVANNLSGEYAHRTCCVLGIRGSADPPGKARRHGAGAVAARGPGVGRRQSRGCGGRLRAACQGTGRAAHSHAQEPYAPRQSAGRRPARPDRRSTARN